MASTPLKSSAGFTYIAAIVMVVIMGIMLAQAAQYWSMRMQREREVELLYTDTQYRDAMRRWYRNLYYHTPQRVKVEIENLPFSPFPAN